MVKVKSCGPPAGLLAIACKVDVGSPGWHRSAVYYYDQDVAESAYADDRWGDGWVKGGAERFEVACRGYWRRFCGEVPSGSIFYRCDGSECA